jgi:hypothetical protein
VAVKSAVGALFVVVLAEAVELALPVGAGRRRRLGGEPALQGLVISPDWVRIRLIVAAAGALRPSRSKCQAIVTAPASNPRAVSVRRSSITRSRTRAGVAAGFVLGRRERGSNASRPPSR